MDEPITDLKDMKNLEDMAKKDKKKHKKKSKREKKRRRHVESIEDVSSESSASSSSNSSNDEEDNSNLTKAKALLKFKENYQKRLEQREKAAGFSKGNVKQLFDSSVPLDIEDLKAEFDNAPEPSLDSNDILRGAQQAPKSKRQIKKDLSNVTIGKLPSKAALKPKSDKLVNQFFAKEIVTPKPKTSIKIGPIISKIEKPTSDASSETMPPGLEICPVTPPDGFTVSKQTKGEDVSKKEKLVDVKKPGPRIIHQVSEPDPEPAIHQQSTEEPALPVPEDEGNVEEEDAAHPADDEEEAEEESKKVTAPLPAQYSSAPTTYTRPALQNEMPPIRGGEQARVADYANGNFHPGPPAHFEPPILRPRMPFDLSHLPMPPSQFPPPGTFSSIPTEENKRFDDHPAPLDPSKPPSYDPSKPAAPFKPPTLPLQPPMPTGMRYPDQRFEKMPGNVPNYRLPTKPPYPLLGFEQRFFRPPPLSTEFRPELLPPPTPPRVNGYHPKEHSEAKAKSPTTPEIDPRAVKEALRLLQGNAHNLDDDVVRRALVSIKEKQKTEKRSYSSAPTRYKYEKETDIILTDEAEKIVEEMKEKEKLEKKRQTIEVEKAKEVVEDPDELSSVIPGPDVPNTGLPEPDRTPAINLDQANWKLAGGETKESESPYTFPPHQLKEFAQYSDYYMHYYQQAYSVQEEKKSPEAEYPVSKGYNHKRAEKSRENIKESGRAVLFNKEEIKDLVIKRKKIAQEMVKDPSSSELMDKMEAVQRTLHECGVADTEIEMMESAQMQSARKKRRQEDCPAWTRLDMFTGLPTVRSVYGIKILKKLGWVPGQRLGVGCPYGSAFGVGSLEPLEFEIKTDQGGLISGEEKAIQKGKKYADVMPTVITTPLPAPRQTISGKNPIIVLAEVCSKRKWKQPEYTFLREDTVNGKKMFYFQVVVKNTKHVNPTGSTTKRKAKQDSAQVCLEKLGMMTSKVPNHYL